MDKPLTGFEKKAYTVRNVAAAIFIFKLTMRNWKIRLVINKSFGLKIRNIHAQNH